MSLKITNIIPDTVGKRIRKVREQKGFTQKQLGELSGIAEPTIRRYELGKLNPKYATIEKIASALDCNPHYLLDGRPTVGDGTPAFQSGRRVVVEVELDEDLVHAVSQIATDENKTLQEEIEDTLFWAVQAKADEEYTNTDNF